MDDVVQILDIADLLQKKFAIITGIVISQYKISILYNFESHFINLI